MKELEDKLASDLNEALLDLVKSRLSVRLPPLSSMLLGSTSTSPGEIDEAYYDIDLYDLECSVLSFTDNQALTEPSMPSQYIPAQFECGKCVSKEKVDPSIGERLRMRRSRLSTSIGEQVDQLHS